MRCIDSYGFTLIEMLIVLVLISVSVALVYPGMLALRDRFDERLAVATTEKNSRKETFVQFVTDGLPQKRYSSPTK